MFIKPSLTSPNSDSCHIHSPVQNASIKFPMRVTVGGGGLIWKFKQKLHIIAIVRHLNLSLRWQTDTFGIRKLFLLSLAWELCTSSKSKRDTFHYNNCQSFYSTSCANLSQTVNPTYQYVFTDISVISLTTLGSRMVHNFWGSYYTKDIPESHSWPTIWYDNQLIWCWGCFVLTLQNRTQVWVIYCILYVWRSGKVFFWPGWERCGSANGGLNKEARDASASRKFRIKFA